MTVVELASKGLALCAVCKCPLTVAEAAVGTHEVECRTIAEILGCDVETGIKRLDDLPVAKASMMLLLNAWHVERDALRRRPLMTAIWTRLEEITKSLLGKKG